MGNILYSLQPGPKDLLLGIVKAAQLMIIKSLHAEVHSIRCLFQVPVLRGDLIGRDKGVNEVNMVIKERDDPLGMIQDGINESLPEYSFKALEGELPGPLLAEYPEGPQKRSDVHAVQGCVACPVDKGRFPFAPRVKELCLSLLDGPGNITRVLAELLRYCFR